MKPTRILLVDPQPVVCAGLGSLIAGFGPEWEICGSASDGFEAVAKAVELVPDIVVMEYELPHLDGLGVARELGKRLCPVEVLIFSGITSGVQLGMIWRSAVRGCLLKTEGSEVLALALQTLRAGHPFRSAGISALCQNDQANGEVAPVITRRQTQVLNLICEGKPTKQVADQLGVSHKTIETHRTHLLRKFGLRSSVELVRFAIAQGWVKL
jgi:DNA-binding NarL/FixJ family response regulator